MLCFWNSSWEVGLNRLLKNWHKICSSVAVKYGDNSTLFGVALNFGVLLHQASKPGWVSWRTVRLPLKQICYNKVSRFTDHHSHNITHARPRASYIVFQRSVHGRQRYLSKRYHIHVHTGCQNAVKLTRSRHCGVCAGVTSRLGASSPSLVRIGREAVALGQGGSMITIGPNSLFRASAESEVAAPFGWIVMTGSRWFCQQDNKA